MLDNILPDEEENAGESSTETHEILTKVRAGPGSPTDDDAAMAKTSTRIITRIY